MAMSESTKKFVAAYIKADRYPLNLPLYGSNNGSLLAHRNLLLENAPYLFHQISKIPVLELKGTENPKDSGKRSFILKYQSKEIKLPISKT